MSTPTIPMAPEARLRSAGLIIGVLALAGMVVAIMQTLIVPLIPELPHLLGVSPDDASWLITATLLASAVATPSLTRLADMAGKRRMMLIALASLTAGSVLGALGTSLGLLILARVLQGVGMSLIPIAISIMRDELPRERLGAAVALVSATLGIGAAVGLPLSGFIYQHFGWHALFWVSAIVGAVMIGAVLAVVPESRLRTGGSFDLLGAALLSAALVGLLLGITKGGTWGWSSGQTLASFGAAVVLLAIWVPWELRVDQPLVDLRTSGRRPVLLTNIASFGIGFAMYCNLLTTTQILQMPPATGYGFGLTVMQAGLAMLPAAATMVLLAPVSARITHSFGARVTLMCGAALLATGYVLRILLITTEWQVILGAVIVSAGTALSFASMPVLIMRSVPATETAAANGLNSVVRSVGTSTASAAVAAILTTVTISVGGHDLPSEAAFRLIFVIASSGALAGGIIAFFLPGHTRSSVADDVALRPTARTQEVVGRGRVVDSEGAPVEHAVVTVDGAAGDVDWTHTDAHGAFTVALPAWGEYTVRVEFPDHSTHLAPAAFTDGGEAPVIALDRITA
jgi:MFS family permease